MVLAVNNLTGFGGGRSSFPVIASYTTGTVDNNNVITVTKPSGTVAGDLLIILGVYEGNTIPTSTSVSTSFTSVQFDSTSASVDLAITAMGRIADGTEPSSFDMTWVDGGSEDNSYACLRISNVASGTVAGVTDSNETACANSSTLDLASLTISWGATINTLVLACALTEDGMVMTGSPSGYTQEVLYEPDPTQPSIYVFSKLVQASSEDPGAFTFDVAQSRGGFVVAIKGI